jgi:alpha-1,3-mannosyltransferase
MATSESYAKLLMILHLPFLIVFLIFKWAPITQGIGAWLKALRLNEIGGAVEKKLDPRYVALTMFTCNLLGIVCARSLHY